MSRTNAHEATIESIAASRRTSAAALRRSLRGDLERIVQKALNDDPARRYESVGDLADDLRRYVAGHPVLARPDSVWYRASKFVSRHAIGTALAILVALALIASSIYSAYQARIAHEQLARADAVRQFLVGVFENADPDENKGQTITAHQLLEKGEQQLSSTDVDQPAIHADLTGLIGSLYFDLGDYARGEPLLKQGITTATDARIPDEIKARNLRALASMEVELRTFDAAIEHAQQGLALAQQAGSRGAEEAIKARRAWASALIGKGKAKEAQPILRMVLTADRSRYGDRSQPVAEDLVLLGSSLDEITQGDEAAAAFREGIAITRASRGDMNTNVANSYNFLGILLGHRGDYAGSEAALRESLRIREQLHGPEHRETLVVRSNLLRAIERQGRIADALPGRLQFLEISKKMADARPEELAYAYYFLASDYAMLGQLKDAESAYRESLAIWAKTQGSNHEIDSADPLSSLAADLQLQGRYTEAETLFREVIDIARSHESRSSLHWIAWSRGSLGNLLRLQHRYPDALAEARAAVDALNQPGNEADPSLVVLQSILAETELDAGDASKAESVASSALATTRKTAPAKSFRLGLPLFAMARTKLALGHADEAEPLLREALAVRSPPLPENDLRVLEVQVELANALSALGKKDEARQLRAAIDPLLAKLPSPYATDLRNRLSSTH